MQALLLGEGARYFVTDSGITGSHLRLLALRESGDGGLLHQRVSGKVKNFVKTLSVGGI